LIMENPIHLIASSRDLSKTMQPFKSFTARRSWSFPGRPFPSRSLGTRATDLARAFCQQIHQVPARYSKQIRNHGVSFDVSRLEELMSSPFEISQTLHVGSSQPCEFSPLPDFSGWNEASFEKPVTQKTGQPLAVANIGLPPRDILYVSGIDQDDLHVAFEHIVNGAPVDPRALHSHNWAIMLAEPVSHSDEIIGEGPEFLHLHPLTSKHAAGDQACRNPHLVNTETTTNRTHDVYNSVIILANYGCSPFFGSVVL